jgi:predicted DNA-binding transcriptional regulator AlpA
MITALHPIDVEADPTETVRVERLIDRQTLCDLLDISAEALRQWIRAGKFPPPFLIGNIYRWRAADYNAWLADQMKPRGNPRPARRIKP